MLTNPEKYAVRRARKEAEEQQQSGAGHPEDTGITEDGDERHELVHKAGLQMGLDPVQDGQVEGHCPGVEQLAESFKNHVNYLTVRRQTGRTESWAPAWCRRACEYCRRSRRPAFRSPGDGPGPSPRC